MYNLYACTLPVIAISDYSNELFERTIINYYYYFHSDSLGTSKDGTFAFPLTSIRRAFR